MPPIRVALRWGACLLIGALSGTAPAASSSQQELQAVLRSRPDLVHGQVLFETCAACHGSQGAGVSDGTVPAIAGQHFSVVVHQLVDYRHGRRWDMRMEHFTEQHSLNGVQDMADVAAFISQMAVTRAPDHGSGEYASRGEQLYASRCRSCHGANAEGDEHNPRLAGQHYGYLLQQMHYGLEGQRPNFPAEHLRLLQPLEPADLAGVADYLSRLGL